MRLLFFLLFPLVLVAQQTTVDEDDFREALAKRLMKSAVVVHTTHKQTQRAGKTVITQRFHITLSGFLYDKDGHIVTVGHVIKDAEFVEVEKPNGSRVKAKVIGNDPWTNVGLLKIGDTEGIEPVEWGGKIAVGRRVMTVSSPLGLKNTVAFGYIAGRRRTLLSRQGTAQRLYSGMLQLSIPPALADAGGLVVDYNGHLVGMVASAYLRPPMVEHLERLLLILAHRIDSFTRLTERVIKDKQLLDSLKKLRESTRRLLFPERFLEGLPPFSMTFAVPADQIRDAVRRILRSGGRRPWLGVQVQSLTEVERKQLKIEGGVKVVDVVKGSPAEKAGVKRFDILIALNGSSTKTLEELSRAIRTCRPGQTVTLTVFRRGKMLKIKVNLGSR